MIAPENDADHRICLGCRRTLAIVEFRYRNKAQGTRHRRCRDCSREDVQKKRETKKKRAVRKGLHDLRRKESLETVRNLLESLIHKVGGVEALLTLWWQLMTDEDLPISYRIAAAKTTMHLLVMVDAESYLSELNADPVKRLRVMREDGQLLRALREMYSTGELTIDDLDPAPGGPIHVPLSIT
ncbi:MAG: hypothetical protein IH991_19790 [Planctomycetes bacterium]|nr:hypothetical protein [Planctomycetota bacterium]